MPLIEVVTRAYKRKRMLAVNQASVQAQLCIDWTQTLLVDSVGMGVGAANTQLAYFTPKGDYVLVLDDDDALRDNHAFIDLERTIFNYRQPPAIIWKMDHGSLGILPDVKHWEKDPVRGHIGCSAIVTRRDVWMRNRTAWASGKYDSDYDFILSVWEENSASIVWLDRVGSHVQRISKGEPEHA